jgi:adenylate kinase family enzyme
MARADLILEVVAAARQGNRQLLESAVHALAAEERSNQHHVLADRLESTLRQNGDVFHTLSLQTEPALDFLMPLSPRRSLRDLVLPHLVRRVVEELIAEHHRAEVLRAHGVEPRHRVILVGPPGNGKTSLAEALAEGMLVELFALRYETIIGSYLGETARRLQAAFDLVRGRHCVLFIDEFDAIAKERGDLHETGEIKRVVSSLLLQIDSAPSHVVIVAATNHPELLDRASWRRFQIRLSLPMPSQSAIAEWLRQFEKRSRVRLTPGAVALAHQLRGSSFAEVEEFATSVLRHWILDQPDSRMSQIVAHQLAEKRAQPAAGKS